MSDFIKLVNSKNPRFFIAPLFGTYTPFDSYKRTADVTANPVMVYTKKGYGFCKERIKYANGSEYQIKDSVVFFGVDSFKTAKSYNQRFTSLRDGSGNMWTIYYAYSAGTSYLYAYIGSTAHLISIDLSGSRSIALRIVDGATVRLFVDGLYYGVMSGGNASLSSINVPLYVAGWYFNTNSLESVVQAEAIFAESDITNKDISDIHKSFSESIVGKEQKLYKERLANPVKDLWDSDMSGFVSLGNTKSRDISDSNKDFSIGKFINIKRDCPVGKSFGFDDSLVSEIYSSDSIFDDMEYLSISFWILVISAVAGDRIFDKNSWGAYANPDGSLVIFNTFVGLQSWTYPINSVSFSKWVHIGIVYKRDDVSEDPIVYINGILINYSSKVSSSGSATSDAAYDLNFGNSSNPVINRYLDCHLSDIKVKSGAVTEEEIRNEFLNGAIKRDFSFGDSFGWANSIGTVATNGAIGPFIVNNNSLEITEIDGIRSILGKSASSLNSAGYAINTSNSAYGSWFVRVKTSVGNSSVSITSNENTRYNNSSTHNGYELRFDASNTNLYLHKITNGSVISNIVFLAGVISQNTWYDFLVTRYVMSGTFKVWYKKTDSKEWILAGSGSDSTYTNSSFLVLTLYENCVLRNIIKFRHSFDPTYDPKLFYHI